MLTKKRLIIALVSVAVLVGFGLAIKASSDGQQERVQACERRGGQVIDSTKSSTVTTIEANGKVGVGVTSNTTYYCLSPEGGIWDIW